MRLHCTVVPITLPLHRQTPPPPPPPLPLQGDTSDCTLSLRSVEAWRPSGRVQVHTAQGVHTLARPSTRYFQGSIVGAPGSGVVLLVEPDGGLSGLATRGKQAWELTHAAGPQAAAVGTGPAPGGLGSIAAGPRPERGGLNPRNCAVKGHSHRRAPKPSAASSKAAVQVGAVPRGLLHGLFALHCLRMLPAASCHPPACAPAAAAPLCRHRPAAQCHHRTGPGQPVCQAVQRRAQPPAGRAQLRLPAGRM